MLKLKILYGCWFVGEKKKIWFGGMWKAMNGGLTFAIERVKKFKAFWEALRDVYLHLIRERLKMDHQSQPPLKS